MLQSFYSFLFNQFSMEQVARQNCEGQNSNTFKSMSESPLKSFQCCGCREDICVDQNGLLNGLLMLIMMWSLHAGFLL